MKRSKSVLTLCALSGAFIMTAAEAYVGPGAGISLIGALIGLLSAIGLAVFAILRWPIRRYMMRRRAARSAATESGSTRNESGASSNESAGHQR